MNHGQIDRQRHTTPARTRQTEHHRGQKRPIQSIASSSEQDGINHLTSFNMHFRGGTSPFSSFLGIILHDTPHQKKVNECKKVVQFDGNTCRVFPSNTTGSHPEQHKKSPEFVYHRMTGAQMGTGTVRTRHIKMANHRRTRPKEPTSISGQLNGFFSNEHETYKAGPGCQTPRSAMKSTEESYVSDHAHTAASFSLHTDRVCIVRVPRLHRLTCWSKRVYGPSTR